MLFNTPKPPLINDDGCPLIASFKSWEEVGQFIYETHLEYSMPNWMAPYLNMEKIGLDLVSNYYTWIDNGDIIAIYEKEKEEYIQYQE